LSKHGKNINGRLRKIHNIQLATLAKVIRTNCGSILVGNQLEKNFKLFRQVICERIKTPIAFEKNRQAQCSSKQNPFAFLYQGNSAHPRTLASYLIAGNPGTIVNTKKEAGCRYFIPLNPHTSPVHSTKMKQINIKKQGSLSREFGARSFFIIDPHKNNSRPLRISVRKKR